VTAMVQIVQGIIPADVVSLLKGTRGLLKTFKALPTGLEMLGLHGVTVKEVALVRCAPKDTHPLLTRQVDGVGIGSGTSRVRGSTRHLVSASHILKVPANDEIRPKDLSQGVSLMHASTYRCTRGPREWVLAPCQDCQRASDFCLCCRKLGLGGWDFRY